MTSDLDLTRACAEAMGKKHWPHYRLKDCIEVSDDGTGRCAYIYDPLHDDAQAMAMVKKFRLYVYPLIDGDKLDGWHVEYGKGIKPNGGESADTLNRAICECVAKMRGAGK